MKLLKFFFLILFSAIKFSFSQSWMPVGSGFDKHVISLFSDTSTGILYAGGRFDSSGTIPINRIARWNGTSWDSMGTGLTNGNVNTISKYGGFIYAGGSFPTAGNTVVNYFTRWNGTGWDSIGINTSNCNVKTMCEYNGELYVGGGFPNVGNLTANNIARWNGTSRIPICRHGT